VEDTCEYDVGDQGAHPYCINANVSQLQNLVSTFDTHRGIVVKLPSRPPAFMVSTCFGLWQETLPENSNAPSTNDTLYQLQACMAEMECCHKEEHRKLKADHDELEASVRRPQGDDTLLIRSTNTSRVNHIPIKPTIHGRPQCLTHTPP